jgi:hypothetical protein
MISAAQCRSACALLGWSVAKLATAASVSASAIDDFEAERRAPLPAVAGPIRRAFEPVGVAFLPGENFACAKGAVSKLAATTLAFAGDSPAEATPLDRWYHADATPLSNKRRRSSARRRSVLSASRLLALLAT